MPDDTRRFLQGASKGIDDYNAALVDKTMSEADTAKIVAMMRDRPFMKNKPLGPIPDLSDLAQKMEKCMWAMWVKGLEYWTVMASLPPGLNIIGANRIPVEVKRGTRGADHNYRKPTYTVEQRLDKIGVHLHVSIFCATGRS